MKKHTLVDNALRQTKLDKSANALSGDIDF